MHSFVLEFFLEMVQVVRAHDESVEVVVAGFATNACMYVQTSRSKTFYVQQSSPFELVVFVFSRDCASRSSIAVLYEATLDAAQAMLFVAVLVLLDLPEGELVQERLA